MRAIKTTTISIVAVGLLAGSVVGVTAQEEESAGPEVFTGRISCGGAIASGTVETDDGVTRARGQAWQPSIIVMSDPRFDGKVSVTGNSDVYHELGDLEVWNSAFRIENEEGAWAELPFWGPAFADGMQWEATTVWVGEGAYDGHIAFTEQSFQDCSWDISGVIIEGDLPPVVEAIPPR